MIEFDYTGVVFAVGLIVGVTLDLLLLRTLLAPPFRIWPTPEPGSWQSLTFWGLFRGGMVLTFVVAVLDWNSAGLVDLSRLIIGLPLFLVGFGITVCGYFNLGLGNTYCGADGLVSHGLYRFSRNPQYASSIMGLVGLVICADSWLALPLAALMSGAYVLMALVEEAWLDARYGASYHAYCERTARFFDVQGLVMAMIEKRQPSRRVS
ncbi:MAG: PEMT/PEM2 methyltransferase family protein [Hyphomicrobiales bacterium]